MQIEFATEGFTIVVQQIDIERHKLFGCSFLLSHILDTPRYPIEAVCEAMNKPRAYVVSKLKQYRKSNYYHYSSNEVKESELDVFADLYVNNLKAKHASQVTNIESAVDQLSNFFMLFTSGNYDNVDSLFEWGKIDEESIRQSFIRNVKKLSSRRNRCINVFAGMGYFGEKVISPLDIILAGPPCQSPSDWYDDYDPTLFTYRYKKQTEQQEDYRDRSLLSFERATSPTLHLPTLLTSHVVHAPCSTRHVHRSFTPHSYYHFGSADDVPDAMIHKSVYETISITTLMESGSEHHLSSSYMHTIAHGKENAKH